MMHGKETRLSELALKNPERFANWLELHRIGSDGEYVYDRDTGVRKADGVKVFDRVTMERVPQKPESNLKKPAPKTGKRRRTARRPKRG